MTARRSSPSPTSLVARILTIRGSPVLLDADLAELYGVTTKALNQAVKRNLDRFPSDFRFRLTAVEREEVVTNCDHLRQLRFSSALPWVFTEHGAIMAASVLSSEQAVEMSILEEILATLRRLVRGPEAARRPIGFGVRSGADDGTRGKSLTQGERSGS